MEDDDSSTTQYSKKQQYLVMGFSSLLALLWVGYMMYDNYVNYDIYNAKE
jgi:hypothetical protein